MFFFDAFTRKGFGTINFKAEKTFKKNEPVILKIHNNIK